METIMRSPLRSLATILLAALACPSQAQYQQPPEPLLGVMRAPLPAMPMLDPTGKTLMLVQQGQYPSIARVAEPYLKLAGVRIEPRAHTRHDMASGYGIRTCLDSFSLVDVDSRKRIEVQLPANACPGWPRWSPNGQRFAFDNTTDTAVELWIGDAATGKTRRVDGVKLNTILDSTIQWQGARDALVVKAVPSAIGAAPQRAAVPPGPEIKDASERGGESSTYEARDTLSSQEDVALFDYYARSQLLSVDAETGASKAIGAAGPIGEVDVAPDGRHVRVHTLQQPYSFVTTWQRFGQRVDVLDMDSGTSYAIANEPAAESVPVRGVPTGPRDFQWRANESASLIYAEALDGGDWKNTVPERDRVLMLRAPFKDKAREIARTAQRFAGLSWFERGSRALLTQYDANRSWYTVSLVDVKRPKAAGKVLWSLSMNERYENPGSPLTRRLPNGAEVLLTVDGHLFLSGAGASPQGDRPFLDRYSLADGSTLRLFRSAPDAFESVLGMIGDGPRFMTWHQSLTSPPNAFVRSLGDEVAAPAKGEAAYQTSARALTDFPDPAPLVRQVKKRLVHYTRKDGVPLSFTLYTPPGYVEGTRVPTILYAYPADFADPSQAGQVRGSEYTFTRLSNYRLLLLAGYAILDNASFPIVGDPKNAYDTYLEQLVADADAAVAKGVELGVVDPERIGVTGHSHGALMTANLLAHTDLFRAGVASSGGYNKTLTPFGFQNERRSFWAAPKVYGEASSFFHADKINEPLLIVHGSDDANPGTEVTQSPRLFQAIRGLGGITRLVMLPHEPHWYTARESNEHFIYEMLTWFDRYVKNATPRQAGSAKPAS